MRHSLSLLSLSVCAALLTTPSFAKETGYLFVSSERDHNITVLDGNSYEVIKKIQTGERPRHLQFNPERTLIYVAASRQDAIDIIDIESLELIDRIAHVEDPELFDLSPDGKIMYISLEDDAELGVLDLEQHFAERAGKPNLSTVPPEGEERDDEDDDDDNGDTSVPGMRIVSVGEEPEGVLVSGDGKTVYVASEVANIVHVIDTKSLDITANILVQNRPRRMIMTDDQSELWVSNELSGSVSIIDPSRNEVIETIDFLPPGFRKEDVTPVGITFTADNKTAMVALGRANHVAFVDVESREIQDYVLVGSRAWNIALTRDNSRAYVVNGLSDDISIIDMSTRRVTRSIPVGRVPHTVLIDD